jgi:hypothetical protein
MDGSTPDTRQLAGGVGGLSRCDVSGKAAGRSEEKPGFFDRARSPHGSRRGEHSGHAGGRAGESPPPASPAVSGYATTSHRIRPVLDQVRAAQVDFATELDVAPPSKGDPAGEALRRAAPLRLSRAETGGNKARRAAPRWSETRRVGPFSANLGFPPRGRGYVQARNCAIARLRSETRVSVSARFARRGETSCAITCTISFGCNP